jgi:endonuclease-3 related protein
MAGAILVQRVSWTNAARAVEGLRERGWLDPRRLAEADLDAVAAAVKPAGFHATKARRLRDLAAWVVARFGADPGRMKAVPTGRLREELLERPGIGPETADAILLYALGLPSFVADAYTARVLERHGWSRPGPRYAEMKALFEAALPRDAELFNEAHALLVALGKDRCGRTPDCAGCPLETLLPGKRKPPASSRKPGV